MTSFVIAEENCRIESVLDMQEMERVSRNAFNKQWGNHPFLKWSRIDEDGYGYLFDNGVEKRNSIISTGKRYKDIEICDSVEPPKSAQELVDAWNKCESGKASPLFVGSPDQLKWLNGRPVKKLMCKEPSIDAVIYFDSWDDYAKDHNPKIPDFNDKSPDEPEKPTDPVDPTDPKDPKPGEGGDGENPGTGDNGSENDNGGCIGNNCGNGNGNEDGKGLTKSDVTQAIKDADILGCNGNNCKAGDFLGLGGDSGFADIPKSFWESKYESHDLMKLYEEKIESTGDSIVAQLRNINTDLGQGTCPVVELPEEFGSFQFDCDFLLLIKSAFLFSATLTALFIVFRR